MTLAKEKSAGKQTALHYGVFFVLFFCSSLCKTACHKYSGAVSCVGEEDSRHQRGERFLLKAKLNFSLSLKMSSELCLMLFRLLFCLPEAHLKL